MTKAQLLVAITNLEQRRDDCKRDGWPAHVTEFQERMLAHLRSQL